MVRRWYGTDDRRDFCCDNLSKNIPDSWSTCRSFLASLRQDDMGRSPEEGGTVAGRMEKQSLMVDLMPAGHGSSC